MTQTTDKTIIDTSPWQMRVIKSGSFTLVIPALSTSNSYEASVTFDDVFYSYKNIVDVFYIDADIGTTLSKLNWSSTVFSISDGGSDKLKISTIYLAGSYELDITINYYYKVYSGTYA